MRRTSQRINAVTRVAQGSLQDRVAQALYEHDALRATAPWHPWSLSTAPKRLRYLDRAAAVIAVMEGSEGS